MTEWHFAQNDPADELAILHHFSIKKIEAQGPVEFVITVKEYATPKDHTMKFFATADKQVFQKGVPFTPVGWGGNLLKALAECILQIKQFPYEA
ncbi:MAG: hypothetical protein HY046_04935, partial [Acidobacteria bacterium]|nr:hypothetical protein [Acidobacteriota bacterium]